MEAIHEHRGPHPGDTDTASSTGTKCHTTIGDIEPAKESTTLHFNIHSDPAATVFDDHHNLICFFALQCSNKENGGTTTRTLSSSSTNNNDRPFYYFFSPLYFGESPVACLGPPDDEVHDESNNKGMMKKTIALYTFKRKYDEQPISKKRGYFGERMYTHGYLTQNQETNEYSYFRCPQTLREDKDSLELKDLHTPHLTGSCQDNNIKSGNDPRWLVLRLYHNLLHLHTVCTEVGHTFENIEFHRPPSRLTETTDDEECLICIDIPNKSLKVAPECDIIEDICIWCAYNILLGYNIG